MYDTMTPSQKNAYDKIMNKENIFLTGSAGTGKSFLIKMLQNEFGTNIQVTAMTGAAALLIGGKTIHSWAGIGIGEGEPEELMISVKRRGCIMKWRKTQILVIDEISMMSADLFYKLNAVAKIIRKNDKPFGGMQLILSGDFFQLPPVQQQPVHHEFCFETNTWNEVVHDVVVLKEIIRQSEPELQKLLEEVKIGQLSCESKALLEAKTRETAHNNDIIPTKIFPTNKKVESENNTKLKILNTDIKTFYANGIQKKCIIEPSKLEEIMKKNLNVSYKLCLSIGSQVMLLYNKDAEKGLVNGSIGILIAFSQNGLPIVRFMSGYTTTIDKYTWKINPNDNDCIQISQVPLMLAWAITIHKSQGASMDCVEIDIGHNIFAYGQAYVALSRVRNLKGLHILNFTESSIRSHPKVLKFYKQFS